MRRLNLISFPVLTFRIAQTLFELDLAGYGGGDDWDERGRRSAVLSLGRYDQSTISFSVVTKKE